MDMIVIQPYILVLKLKKTKLYWLPKFHKKNIKQDLLLVLVIVRQQNFVNCTTVKVIKGAKIRNRYNQVPHLTQDTNGKVTNSQ